MKVCLLHADWGIGATAPWDPWDASPPTFEVMALMGTKWSHPTFATGCHFRWVLWEAYGACPDLIAKFKERRKEEEGREWVKHGWSTNGRRGRDGAGKGRGTAFTHMRSPPTFQPWLLLSIQAYCVAAVTASARNRLWHLLASALGDIPAFGSFSVISIFYRAMLCIRGTSHGPVSVCLSVCLSVRPSVRHKSEFY